MRHALVVSLAACTLAISATPSANAVGVRHPFCIQGNDHPALSNCTFDSYEACAASASGRFLSCIPNPYFARVGDEAYSYPARHRAARSPRHDRTY